jgi:hypothetical protein
MGEKSLLFLLLWPAASFQKALSDVVLITARIPTRRAPLFR